MGKIIDGKAISAGLYEEMRQEVEQMEKQYGRRPGLTVIIVGKDPASQVYVQNKEKAAKKMVDLIGANVVVAVGRGISKNTKEGIALAEKLADTVREIHPEICLPGHWTPLSPEVIIEDLLAGEG